MPQIVPVAEIYLAPTADARDTWQATLRHIACEGRCFVLGCNQFVPAGAYPSEVLAHGEADAPRHEYCRGGSAIISPLGQVPAGPLFDGKGDLRADLDLDDVTRARVDFDVSRHYSRPDIFQLTVNTAPKPPVRFA
jgi:nitrilase